MFSVSHHSFSSITLLIPFPLLPPPLLNNSFPASPRLSCQGVYICPAHGRVPNKVERIRGEKTALLPARVSLPLSLSPSLSLSLSCSVSLFLTVDKFQIMHFWLLRQQWRNNTNSRRCYHRHASVHSKQRTLWFSFVFPLPLLRFDPLLFTTQFFSYRGQWNRNKKHIGSTRDWCLVCISPLNSLRVKSSTPLLSPPKVRCRILSAYHTLNYALWPCAGRRLNHSRGS